MQKRLIELVEQRGRLRERVAHQRASLGQAVQPLIAPLAWPTRIAAYLHQGRAYALAHPYVFGTAALGLVMLKPRFVLRWAQRGLLAWRAWRSVRGIVPGVLGSLLRR